MVAIQVSIHGRMDKQKVVSAYNSILISLNKEGTTWMNLDNIMLSEMNQSLKENYYMIPLI